MSKTHQIDLSSGHVLSFIPMQHFLRDWRLDKSGIGFEEWILSHDFHAQIESRLVHLNVKPSLIKKLLPVCYQVIDTYVEALLIFHDHLLKAGCYDKVITPYCVGYYDRYIFTDVKIRKILHEGYEMVNKKPMMAYTELESFCEEATRKRAMTKTAKDHLLHSFNLRYCRKGFEYQLIDGSFVEEAFETIVNSRAGQFNWYEHFSSLRHALGYFAGAYAKTYDFDHHEELYWEVMVEKFVISETHGRYVTPFVPFGIKQDLAELGYPVTIEDVLDKAISDLVKPDCALSDEEITESLIGDQLFEYERHYNDVLAAVKRRHGN